MRGLRHGSGQVLEDTWKSVLYEITDSYSKILAFNTSLFKNAISQRIVFHNVLLATHIVSFFFSPMRVIG